MKESTIQKIEEVLDRILEAGGTKLYQYVAASMESLSGEGNYTERSKCIVQAAKRTILADRLRPLPEPDPKQVDQLLEMVKSMPYAVRDIYMEIAKSMRPAPGGRPRKLNPQARAKLCVRIKGLLPECEDPQDAYRRAAAESRPPVSVSTARRCYREHLRSMKSRSEEVRPRRNGGGENGTH